MTTLVTGATGTVGTALVPVLLDRGLDVRCLSRSPDKLDDLPWRDRVEVVQGDAKEQKDLVAAMQGCDVVYYLIHGLSGGDEATLVEDEVTVATTFALAAEQAGVERIVYLGGLVDEDEVDVEALSPHMRSRYEVGRTLADADLELVELRASLVLGATSDSYRLLEAVAEKIPTLPKVAWTQTRSQPISLRDAAFFLAAATELDPGIYDIGGADVVTFLELVQAYRQAADLEPSPEIDVPFLPKQAASPVAALLADVDPFLARALMSSAEHDSVVGPDRDIRAHVDHQPLTLAEALADARS